MTWNPNHDRDYWRCTPDADLIDAARDSGHELAIALGERLEDASSVDDSLTDATEALADVMGWLRDELDLHNESPCMNDAGQAEARRLCSRYWKLAGMLGREP